MIQSDNQGFLIGEPVAIDKTLAIWGNIGDDIKQIREALANGVSRVPNQQAVKKPNVPVALLSQPQGRSPGKNITEINLPKAITKTETPNRKTSSHSKTASSSPGNTSRDPVTGRFIKNNAPGNSPTTSHDKPADENSNSFSESSVSMMADKIVNAAGLAGGGMEDADPAVKAFNEISQPLSRGYEIFSSGTGRDQKVRNRWFRKIFGELKIFRAEESVFNKATNKILGKIEEKPDAGSGGKGGFLPFLGPGFMAVVLSVISKIPLIGALISSSGNILDMFKGGNKAKGVGGITGTFAGMLGGAKLGATAGAFGGPVVAAIGGIIGGGIGLFFGNKAGQVFGEKIGEWTDQLKQADIGGKISDTWQSFIGDISDKISSTWDAITRFIQDKFDINVKGKLSNVAETVKKSSVGKTVSSVWKSATDSIDSAKDWFLGQTSKRFESGKSGAGTISSGRGDFGGMSYGTYQLSSKQGTLQKFLDSSEYGKQFDGLKPGSPEFNAKWKQIAQSDPGFDKAQHGFIKSTHFDPQMAKLKGAGIDLSDRGAAVQDAIWSTAVQFGGNTSLIEKALGGKDPSSLSDKDIVTAIQDHKIRNNDSLFRSSSNAVRRGTANRAIQEKEQLVSLVDSGLPSISNIAQSAVPTPGSTPRVPTTPKIPDAPAIPEPLASSSGSRNQPVKIESPNEVGQDVKDRKIAHIVTGGMAS